MKPCYSHERQGFLSSYNKLSYWDSVSLMSPLIFIFIDHISFAIIRCSR